jgi:hypothetical protein
MTVCAIASCDFIKGKGAIGLLSGVNFGAAKLSQSRGTILVAMLHFLLVNYALVMALAYS